MGRINHKEQELRHIANMLLGANDYRDMLMKFNGYRMGLTNRYRVSPGTDISKLTKYKRIDKWKEIIEMYK